MASKQSFVIFFRSQPSELYTVEGNRHFMTRRFDRDGEKKAHTQTLAAIYPDADSYEQLIWVCRNLHLPDIAHMVLFLCSDKAGFITGENICIDGGMTHQMIYHGDNGWKLE